MIRFDPWGFKTSHTKYWGWLYILIGLMPFLAVGAITFYVLSLLITDEDLYYKQKEYNNKYSYSSLQVEFSKLDVVAEILPHFILANENERFVPLKFINNTYFKNTTYVQGETTKAMKYSELYFSSDNTTDDLPHLNFNYDYLPAGDSKSSCLHVRVRPKSLPQTSYINYSSLQEMGNGFEARKQYWDSHDPTTGVNLLVWKEFASQNKTDGKEGIIKNNTCYEYSVLKKICIIIGPVEKDQTQGWFYQNGGFEGGSAVDFQKAKPNTVYSFDHIPIEVWANKGAFYDFDSDSTTFGADLSYFGWLSRIGWTLGLTGFISFVIFGGYRLNVPPEDK